MFKRAQLSSRLIASALLMTLAAACSDSSSNSGGGAQPIQTNVSGTVTAGVVANATVEAYRINTNNRNLTFVADALTDSAGAFQINLAGSGPFLLIARTGSFTDEATGNTVNLANVTGLTSLDDARANILEAVIASGVNGGVTLNITPLTTFASRRIANQLLTANDAFEPSNVTTVHQSMGQEFGLGSMTDPRDVFPTDFTDANNSTFIQGNTGDSAVQLGLILSGLSQLAVDLGVTNPLDLIDALADDAQDGLFNGAFGSIGVSAGTMALPQNTGTSGLGNSTSNFLNNNANNQSGTNAATFNVFIGTINTLDVTPGGNTAPFFDPIMDQTVTSSGSLVISGVSPGAPSAESNQMVTFSASTSNASVVATPTFTGTGTTRTLNFTIGGLGSAVITVSAMDDGGTANNGTDTFTRSFTITVNANQAPSFDAIQNQTVNEDSMNNTVSVTNITATEAGQTVTSVTATSSNTAIVPDPVVTGQGATRTLTYSPVADASGTVTITVTAMDNGGTANGGVDTFTQSFDIVVNSVNDAPTFDVIQDQTINEDSTGNTITIMNISTGPANESGQMIAPITVMTSDPAIIAAPTVTGTGPTASFSIDPVADAFGTVMLTVIVQDDGGTANGGIDTTMQTFMVTVNGINDAPSFSMVSNITINEDAQATSQTLNNVVAGPANESGQMLTLMATSSNTALIPNPTFSGNTLSFTPNADQNGTTMITVTLMDDGGTANGGMDTFMQTFMVTVNPVNDAPTFDTVQDQTFDEDSMNNMVMVANLSAGPANENTQNVTLTATSSNTTLLPNPMVNGNTLSFTPNADENGTAMITLTAMDDGGTANGGVDTTTQTFMVTITSINDAPSFDMITNQTVAAGAGQQMITITNVSAGPANENTQVVTVTATSNNTALVANPTITGQGATRTLMYTPSTNMGGTATITVTAMDDGGTANGGVDTFTQDFDIVVTVTPAINMITPDVARVSGGTAIRVATSNFNDFTQTAPTATVAGQTAVVNVVNATDIDVVVPSGLTVGMNQAIVVDQGGDTATIMTLNIVADVAANEVIVNELLPTPTTAVDTNGDGLMSTDDDQFVEVVNLLTTPVDISNFRIDTLSAAATTVHVFSNPTVIPAGGSIVVFAGGTPTGFPAAQMNGSAQLSSTGALGFATGASGGDIVDLVDQNATTINSVTYTASTDAISLNRMIDGDVNGNLVDHNTVVTANGNFSPGFKVDGVTRHNGAPVLSVDMVVPAAARVSGGTTIAVTVSALFGDLTQDNPTVMIGGQTVTANNIMTSSFTFDVPTGLTVGTTTISVMNTAGTATFMTFEVVTDAVAGELVINEFMPDPNGGTAVGTFDSNQDGTANSTQDEFVEIVNTRSTPVDLTGFTISDGASGGTVRHTFPNGTVVPAGASIVVFGGGSLTNFLANPDNGMAQVANGSGNILGLNNSNDEVTLADNNATMLDQETYGASPDGNSFNRAIDGDINSAFVDHTTITAANGARATPGRKVDGTPFP